MRLILQKDKITLITEEHRLVSVKLVGGIARVEPKYVHEIGFVVKRIIVPSRDTTRNILRSGHKIPVKLQGQTLDQMLTNSQSQKSKKFIAPSKEMEIEGDSY